jgi:hypothetical protein
MSQCGRPSLVKPTHAIARGKVRWNSRGGSPPSAVDARLSKRWDHSKLALEHFK